MLFVVYVIGNMSNILSKLLGSGDKLKIIRLFLLNGEEIISPKKISLRSKTPANSVRKVTNLLSSIGFIKKAKRKEEILNNGKVKKRIVAGWMLDTSFPLLIPLKELVLDTTPLSRVDFIKKLKNAGAMKLVVLSGIFIKEENSRIDVLVVGNKIKKRVLEKILKGVEAEVGKELSYAVFDTEDFVYRLNMCDKFIRDILDYPHQKILNTINV